MANKNLVVILDNIRSRFNVGSIFRTADGAGVDKIYLCGYTPIPPHPEITKTALGAQNKIAWQKCSQTWKLIEDLKKENYQIVALEQNKNTIRFDKFKPRWPAALIVGNEVRGLTKQILKRTDKIIYIPMSGKKESLNVAVAFGIAVYQITMLKLTIK